MHCVDVGQMRVLDPTGLLVRQLGRVGRAQYPHDYIAVEIHSDIGSRMCRRRGYSTPSSAVPAPSGDAAGGASTPLIAAATASSPATTLTACSTVRWSPRK